MEGSNGFAQSTANVGTNSSSQGPTEPSNTPRQAMMDEMTQLIRQNRVPEMAWLFLQTCPGDWGYNWGPSVRGTLIRAVRRELSLDKLEEVAATIRFRWDLARYADHLVKVFNLSVPDREICILWDFRKWRSELASGQHRHHSSVWNMVMQGGIKPNLLDHHGDPFERFLHYIVAALTLANLPEDLTRALVATLINYTAGERGFLQPQAQGRPAT